MYLLRAASLPAVLAYCCMAQIAHSGMSGQVDTLYVLGKLACIGRI